MKAEILKKRINDKLTTQKGELKVRFQNIFDFIERNQRFHGCSWARNGRRMTLIDKNLALCEALKLIGVDYVTGNDAPKGGATGDYVELSAKGVRQTAELRKELQQERQKKSK